MKFVNFYDIYLFSKLDFFLYYIYFSYQRENAESTKIIGSEIIQALILGSKNLGFILKII